MFPCGVVHLPSPQHLRTSGFCSPSSYWLIPSICAAVTQVPCGTCVFPSLQSDLPEWVGWGPTSFREMRVMTQDYNSQSGMITLGMESSPSAYLITQQLYL